MSTVTVIALYGLAFIWGPMIGFAPLLLFRPKPDPDYHTATEAKIRFARWLWTRGLKPALWLSVILGVVMLVDHLLR